MHHMNSGISPGRKLPDGRAHSPGFTLIEYMVVLSLSLIFVGIAVPNFVRLDASFRRSQARTQVEGDIIYVRSLALREGGRAAILPSEDGASYTISTGHAPYSGFPGTDDVVVTKRLPSGASMKADGPIVFDARGHVIDEYGKMNSLSLSLAWKNRNFATISLCPMGFIL